MKLVSYRDQAETRLGAVHGGKIINLAAAAVPRVVPSSAAQDTPTVLALAEPSVGPDAPRESRENEKAQTWKSRRPTLTPLHHQIQSEEIDW